MSWDSEFVSPMEIIDLKRSLFTLRDAEDMFAEKDQTPEIVKARAALRIAAECERPDDIEHASIATLRAIFASGLMAVIHPQYAPAQMKRRP